MDIYPIAIRFADLWAVDPHQMVDEIYAPDIHMESMVKLTHAPIQGSAQLHALEERLAAMIPEHRHELVRVIADGRHACLETIVVGPRTGEYAPACVWWWVGDDQVDREVGFFDWGKRSTDSRRIHGTVPAIDTRPRAGRASSREFAESVIDEWTRDPEALVRSRCAPDCVIERVGEDRLDVVAAAKEFAGEGAWTDIQEIAVDGGAVAVLFTRGNSSALSRGTAVFTLDHEDRIVSVRLYWDWAAAVPIEQSGPSK